MPAGCVRKMNLAYGLTCPDQHASQTDKTGMHACMTACLACTSLGLVGNLSMGFCGQSGQHVS